MKKDLADDLKDCPKSKSFLSALSSWADAAVGRKTTSKKPKNPKDPIKPNPLDPNKKPGGG